MNYMSLADHVYKDIADNLKQGYLKPNDKINEQHLSDKLNVSRTPVREALIQLSAEGILEYEPRRGFRVKPLILKEAEDLYQLIGYLDAMAAMLTIDKLTEKEISLLKSLHSKMDACIKTGDFEKYYKYQIEFHDVYLNECGNLELIKTLKQFKMRFIYQDYSDIDKNKLNKTFIDTNNQHLTIISLFESKKGKELEEFLREKHWSVEYAVFDIL